MTATIDTQATRDLIGRVKATHGQAGGSVDALQLAVLTEQLVDQLGLARDALRRAGVPVDEVGDNLADLIERHDREAREAVAAMCRENARLRAGTDRPVVVDYREEWAVEVTRLDGTTQRGPADDAEFAGMVADAIITHAESLNGPTRQVNGVKSTAVVTRSVTSLGAADRPTLVLTPWRHFRDGRVVKD